MQFLLREMIPNFGNPSYAIGVVVIAEPAVLMFRLPDIQRRFADEPAPPAAIM